MEKDIIELNQKRGERLRRERNRKGITQEVFAELADCSIQQISYIENGKRKMTYDSAAKFSEILDVKIEYLMCETDYIASINNTPFDVKRLESLFSNTFSIMFEYHYDLIGIVLPGIGIDKTIASKSKEHKIELLSKICVGKQITGEFILEYPKISETTKHFKLCIETPFGKIRQTYADELYICACNIIQYSQLQFLNLGKDWRDLFGELTPIYTTEDKEFFHTKEAEEVQPNNVYNQDEPEMKIDLFPFYKYKDN